MTEKAELWLRLLKAETEEDLTTIEEQGIPEINQTIEAYRKITALPEFREYERLYSKIRNTEAQTLKNATERERKKWEKIVAKKDAAFAELQAELKEK